MTFLYCCCKCYLQLRRYNMPLGYRHTKRFDEEGKAQFKNIDYISLTYEGLFVWFVPT